MESVAIEGEKAGVSAEKKDPVGLIDNSCLICALGVLDHAGQWLHVLRPYTKWSKIKYCRSSNAPLDT